MKFMRTILYSIRNSIRRFPRLEQAYRVVQEKRLVAKSPVLTPFGFKFLGIPAMQNGTFEMEEVTIVKQILTSVDTFINVGANFGYYCCFALQSGKSTIAFEPIERNLSILYKNLHANKWLEQNVEIFPLALSNRTGLIEIWGGGTGASLIRGWASTPEVYKQIVPVSTLDTILGDRLVGKKLFLLIDIEGAEYLMMQGATQSLYRTPKPIWMVEIATTEHQPQGGTINPHLLATFQIFWEAGYEAWVVGHDNHKVTPEDIDLIIASGNDAFVTHNFLFVEQGKKAELLTQNINF